MDYKETAYDRLREYAEIGEKYETDDESDFDKFCQAHNDDITNICDCIDEIVYYIDTIDPDDFEKQRDYNLIMGYMNDILDLIKVIKK